jgi:hypothetical protein
MLFRASYVLKKHINKEAFISTITRYQDSNIQLPNGAYLRFKEESNSLIVYPYYRGMANTTRVEINIDYKNIQSDNIVMNMVIRPTKFMRLLILLLPISFMVNSSYFILIRSADQGYSLNGLLLSAFFFIGSLVVALLDFGQRAQEFYDFFRKI